jgi:FkbM family methyltransferase
MSQKQAKISAKIAYSARLIRHVARHVAYDRLTAPRRVGIDGSSLRFHVHSWTEEYRIRNVHETWTIAWMRKLPQGSVVYDVGANIGVGSLIAAEDVARAVKVVAIEPFPVNFASLVKNVVLNGLQDRVTALPVGLGRTSGLFAFNWSGSRPGAALHSFGQIVRPRTSEVAAPVAHHHCMCYRLDDLVRFPGMPFPTHLKIDVDGGELDVLAGAEEVLRDSRCRGLQIEVIDTDDDKRERSRGVVELLGGFGYSLAGEFPHAFPRVRDLQFAR